MDSPNPVPSIFPSLETLTCINLLNIFSIYSSGIPRPLSSTETIIFFSFLKASIIICPSLSSLLYFIAFVIRLVNTNIILFISARTKSELPTFLISIFTFLFSERFFKEGCGLPGMPQVCMPFSGTLYEGI